MMDDEKIHAALVGRELIDECVRQVMLSLCRIVPELDHDPVGLTLGTIGTLQKALWRVQSRTRAYIASLN